MKVVQPGVTHASNLKSQLDGCCRWTLGLRLRGGAGGDNENEHHITVMELVQAQFNKD